MSQEMTVEATTTSLPSEHRPPPGFTRPGNHVIVVFGATGDLAMRKLLPGLFHLAAIGLMPDRY
jgi:glucose-6-phosphate 1-dehydrogenase